MRPFQHLTWCFPGMLRAAATVVALLAALPAVTPLLGGYRAFSECRNLTHLMPGRWPDVTWRNYNYTGLVVMPNVTCSGVLVCPTQMLSNALCRLWKEGIDFGNDIDEDGCEVRIGLIQGDVSEHLYQRQPVKRFYHMGKSKEEVLKYPLMIVEVHGSFSWPDIGYPGILRTSPLTDKSQESIIGDVIGYEHSVNMPIYHQSYFDAHLYNYHEHCKKYGRTQWNLTHDAICTWDVSPVRTICSMDRGAPVYYKKHIIAIVVGIVDDFKDPGLYCGGGRVHYNVFLQVGTSSDWIKKVTGSKAKVFNMVDGKVFEESDEVSESEDTILQHGNSHPTIPPRQHHHHARAINGAAQLTTSAGPLLLAAVGTVARLASQD